MKEVFVTHNLAEAHLVRGVLENAGIAAVVQNDILYAGLGETASEETLPKVCVVDDSEAERAAEIIADWRRAKPDAPSWECPECGETIGGQFTACWECGAERP